MPFNFQGYFSRAWQKAAMGIYWCELCGGSGLMLRPGQGKWRLRLWPRYQKCTHCDGAGREPPPWNKPSPPPPPPPKQKRKV